MYGIFASLVGPEVVPVGDHSLGQPQFSAVCNDFICDTLVETVLLSDAMYTSRRRFCTVLGL
jgi:hypothetical protein